MKEVGFVCRSCGEKFTAMILEEREAQERRMPTQPVRCPQCRSADVERR